MKNDYLKHLWHHLPEVVHNVYIVSPGRVALNVDRVSQSSELVVVDKVVGDDGGTFVDPNRHGCRDQVEPLVLVGAGAWLAGTESKTAC